MCKNILYNDIYEFDIQLMILIINTYGCTEKSWNLFLNFYVDPDGYPLKNKSWKEHGKIKCTCDGLLSVKRIKHHEGFNNNFVETFTKYRKTPIIFFPSEKYGINWSRYNIFGDRIDHTLFDLKRFCEGKTDCRLESIYNLPKTTAWINSFNKDFSHIVDWLGIRNIFVNENNDIFDLEKCNAQIINEYATQYTPIWSSTYYANIKQKIEIFENQKRS